MNASASGLILGYNHDDVRNARFTDLYDKYITNKVDVNNLPPFEYDDLLRENVRLVAPLGMNHV